MLSRCLSLCLKATDLSSAHEAAVLGVALRDLAEVRNVRMIDREPSTKKIY